MQHPVNRKSAVISALLLGVLCGCVTRTISVTSQPVGALVYLNDEEVGRTPLTVTHRFHGVYDVRLEADPQWVRIPEAAPMLNLTEAELIELAEADEIPTIEEHGQRMVEVGFKPLWTKRATDAPWWEMPGPDLVAEMIPNAAVRQRWHFELEPSGRVDVDALLERAAETEAMLLGTDSNP